jgi:uncharacterized RDD family membrane protein YckC
MTTPGEPGQDPQQPGFHPPPPAAPAPPTPQPGFTPPQGFPPPPQQAQPPQGPPPGGQYYPPAPPVPAAYGYGTAPVGSVPPGMFFDHASGLTMPQGTTLAPVGRRIGAFFLSIVLVIVTLGIGYIIWGLIVWGRGQTPALQVLKMRVWRPATNSKATWGYMALREIIGRIVDGILSLITEVISFVMMVSGKERKTLHDMVAGTVVLYDPNGVITN